LLNYTGLDMRSTLSKERSTCSIRQCCFDIVAVVDGALESSFGLSSMPGKGALEHD